MMRWFTLVRILLPTILFISSNKAPSQNSLVDTSEETSSLSNAIKLYHQFLSPETGLYNGSEYAYRAYYPFTINEGHPFFQSKQFDTGAVFYNNVLYEDVPLLYDMIVEELLTRDPTNDYVIRLNTQRIEWFIISGHTFIKFNGHNAGDSTLPPGFYDLLYNGKTALFKKSSKHLNEVPDLFLGIKKFVVETNEYFIKKDNQYYVVKNKNALLQIMSNAKKEVELFIRKNKLSLKKDKEGTLKKIVAYYDGINNIKTKSN